MLRQRLSVLGIGAVAVLPAGFVCAANVALPEVNPGVRVVGTTTFGSVGATNFLNDNNDGNSTGASMFQVPFSTVAGIPPGSRGFGYDLGGIATIDSLDLSQFVGESPLGPRARLNGVVVHTAAGNFNVSLPDQDNVHIALPAPVATSWVVIEPVSQHPGGDPQVGIDELAVNSTVGTLLPRRNNVALGAAYQLKGNGWNNVRGSFTDDVLAGSNADLTSAAFNGALTQPGNSIDLDLGQSFTVNGLGLAEHDYGGAGGRALVHNARLEFSDDPSFGTLSATRDLVLENVPYQVLDFLPATGQYVRLTVQSQYPNPDGNLGFTEVQVFEGVPEPGAVGALFAALPLLMRRGRGR